MLPYMQVAVRDCAIFGSTEFTLPYLLLCGSNSGLSLVELGLQFNHLYIGDKPFLMQRRSTTHGILGLFECCRRGAQSLTRISIIYS